MVAPQARARDGGPRQARARLQGALLPAARREAGVAALAGPHAVAALHLVPEQLRLAQARPGAQHNLGPLRRRAWETLTDGATASCPDYRNQPHYTDSGTNTC